MSSQATPQSGEQLGQYRLERRLALGGMAEIWLGHDERSGKTVAVKKILPQIATDQSFLDRFFHEIHIQVALRHRNVVELLGFSSDPGNAYIVMEYIDGGSLHSLREQAGKLPWEIAFYVAEETMRGLGAAHKKGIVHRDVKPHNIMWKRDGVVKIADFGISQAEHLTRLTVTGMVVGTPAHMSPEQARGEILDARSDLFSIGTVLYELMTGINPFVADNVTATLRRVVDVNPDPPSLLDPLIPPSTDAVLRKLIAKSRDLRYSTADEAAEACHTTLLREGVENPAAAFREFLRSPKEFVAGKNAQAASAAAQRTEELLKDRSAPPEEALWEAYKTLSCAPESQTAQSLFQLASTRAGQRDKPVDNARIRELEAQLRADPENVGVMLQLAKLYRLERDFLNVMKFFRRLQSVAPRDAYTQGQIAALVGGSRPAAAAQGVGAVSALPAPRAAAPPPPEASPLARWGAIGAAVALGAFCIWWAAQPHARVGESAGDRQRADAIIKAIKGSETPVTYVERPGGMRNAADGGLQQVLEKGALIEKEKGADKAIAYYRDALPRMRPDERDVLLRTIAEMAESAGDRQGALRALDEVIALAGSGRLPAMLKKAELLEKSHDEGAAQRIYEELAREQDPEIVVRATLRLALLLDRGGDVTRALSLYEDVLARRPDTPDAQTARLGAAALYRSQGRSADAQRMYEEVKRRASPGSEAERSAEQGLRTLQQGP